MKYAYQQVALFFTSVLSLAHACYALAAELLSRVQSPALHDFNHDFYPKRL